MDWLRLIRWKNLLIVFLTQLLVWYCLVYDPANSLGLLAILDFLPIAASTVLIAAAGYIINDYFDIKIDIINRPEKVVLEKRIPLRVAIMAHIALNIVAMAMVSTVAIKAHHYEWPVIQLVCIVLLWFYSTHFKRQYMTGNLVVAMLTALTIILLLVYKPSMPMIYFKANQKPAPPALAIGWVFAGYAFFAFMLTWMREIVKDMEDYKGDAEEGCVTMPIKMGLKYALRFTQVIGGAAIAVLGIIDYYIFKAGNTLLGVYALALLIVPLIGWCVFLQRKNTVSHYHESSKLLKIIMLLGVGSLVIYHFTTY